jgi:hypothetical protein
VSVSHLAFTCAKLEGIHLAPVHRRETPGYDGLNEHATHDGIKTMMGFNPTRGLSGRHGFTQFMMGLKPSQPNNPLSGVWSTKVNFYSSFANLIYLLNFTGIFFISTYYSSLTCVLHSQGFLFLWTPI